MRVDDGALRGRHRQAGDLADLGFLWRLVQRVEPHPSSATLPSLRARQGEMDCIGNYIGELEQFEGALV